MINYKKGNLLKDHSQALVNTVNCVGVMGKGIALQFKKYYPDNYYLYKAECIKGNVKIGKMFVTETEFTNPKYIINFPTKNHWRNKSKSEWIESGLKDLRKFIIDNDISSIALPMLGCGNGGLNPNYIHTLIQMNLRELNTTINLYTGDWEYVPVYYYPNNWIFKQLELARVEREKWPDWLKEYRNLNKNGSPKNV